MNPSGDEQLRLPLGEPEDRTLFDDLEEERRTRQVRDDLARSMALPMDHEVELTLQGGQTLRGKLEFSHKPIVVFRHRDPDLMLRIGDVEFSARKIASCVRMD